MSIQREVCTWEKFKQICVVNKALNLQFTMDNGYYRIVGPDNGLFWCISLAEGSDDGNDFRDNYMHLCNYRIGNASDSFATDDFSARSRKCDPVTVTGETENLDILVEESNWVTNGGKLVASGLKIGDWIEVKVIDRDGAHYPAGTVLREWGDLLLDPAGGNSILYPYAGQPPADTFMRLVFHKATRSEGEPDPVVGWTCYFHAREI